MKINCVEGSRISPPPNLWQPWQAAEKTQQDVAPDLAGCTEPPTLSDLVLITRKKLLGVFHAVRNQSEVSWWALNALFWEWWNAVTAPKMASSFQSCSWSFSPGQVPPTWRWAYPETVTMQLAEPQMYPLLYSQYMLCLTAAQGLSSSTCCVGQMKDPS